MNISKINKNMLISVICVLSKLFSFCVLNFDKLKCIFLEKNIEMQNVA